MATTTRVPVGANQDNTARQDTKDYKTPAYAATINLVTRQKTTVFQPGTLTGALTLNVGVGGATSAPFVDDVLKCIFLSDGTGRTVTLGTGLVGTAATLALTASKKGYLEFVFDGVAWIETSRSVLI